MTPEELSDIEAIKVLKARYFRLMDTKQWEAWADIFTEDCTMHAGDRVTEGREAFVRFVRKLLGTHVSVHHGHMPEITLTSPDRATGIWAMYDRVELDPPNGFEGYGHYQEEYTKGADGQWRISRLELTRLKMVPLES